MIEIPVIPASWIEYSGILLAGNGFRTRVNRVLHRINGHLEFAVHGAYVDDNNQWAYEGGRYFETEAAGRNEFFK